jgi:hypothetical protein
MGHALQLINKLTGEEIAEFQSFPPLATWNYNIAMYWVWKLGEIKNQEGIVKLFENYQFVRLNPQYPTGI